VGRGTVEEFKTLPRHRLLHVFAKHCSQTARALTDDVRSISVSAEGLRCRTHERCRTYELTSTAVRVSYERSKAISERTEGKTSLIALRETFSRFFLKNFSAKMSSTHAVIEMSEIKADLKDVKEESVKKIDDSAARTCDITEHAMPHDKLAAFMNTSLEAGLTSEGK